MAAAQILNYELAPSPATIFGCLLPAPWLGALAGVLLACGPAAGLPDRFSPLTLAVTHVLVLGMLAPVMIGALFQLMPVVAGQTVSAARFISPFVAAGSALIAAGLAAGFLSGHPHGFALAAGVAILLYGAIVLALGRTAWKIIALDATTRTLRWIPLALLAVIGFGVTMAGNFAGWWQSDIAYWLDLHVAWGLVGWIAALLLGIASTTVPMFWQSRRPGDRWQAALPVALWVPLLAAFWPQWRSLAIGGGCLSVGLFAAIAAHAVWHARRRFDPSWALWLCSAVSWLAAAVLVAIAVLAQQIPGMFPAWLLSGIPWWTGVLALVGGAVMPVNAMLGKIIPFLVFLHLRRQLPPRQRVPTMQAVLPPARLLWQTRLLLLAYVALLLLPLAPRELALAAGILFAASQALIGVLLLQTLLRYRHELRSLLFNKTVLPQKN